MNNFQKYLPSKKFITTILSLILIIGLVFGLFYGIKGIISLIKNHKIGGEKKEVGVTVEEIIQKDSNKNGIADWEEYLWGLDPTKNGQSNKEFILAKKKTLEENGIISTDSEPLTDSDMLSQEFFATIITLQQTGDLDEETMQSVSEAFGKNIEIIPIADTYTRETLTIVDDSANTKATYYDALTKLINKYSDSDI